MRYYHGLGIGHLGIGLVAEIAPHSLASSPLDQTNAQGVGAECNEEAGENFWEHSADINLGSINWDTRSNKYLSVASEGEDGDDDGDDDDHDDDHEEEEADEEDLVDGHADEEDSDHDDEGDSEYGD